MTAGTLNTNDSDDGPFIDWERFSIRFKGVKKKLGNTDLFRLVCEFIRRIGRKVSHEDIRDLQGKPDMTSGAIRQSVRQFRKKLPELAQYLASEDGYYLLDLPRRKS